MKINYDPLAQDKDFAAVRVHEKKQLVAQMVHKPGLTLWDYNEATKEIQPAEFKPVFDVKANEYVHQVIRKPGHVYFEALNLKNACRKVQKYL